MEFIQKDLFVGIVDHYKTDHVIFIPHITNNVKAWGAGFVIPLGNHFPAAKQAFYAVDDPHLGDIQFVNTRTATICNMFAQEGIGHDSEGNPPIRYDALKKCMTKVKEEAETLQARGKQVIIATPLFGVGLAGGDWGIISEMMAEIWGDLDVKVYFIPERLPPNLKAIKVGEELLIVHKFLTEAEQAKIQRLAAILNEKTLDGIANAINSKDSVEYGKFDA